MRSYCPLTRLAFARHPLPLGEGEFLWRTLNLDNDFAEMPAVAHMGEGGR